MSVAVWANSRDVPGLVCQDARLTDRSVRPWPWQDRAISKTDQLYGQSGWDLGINYQDLADLAGKLSSLRRPGYVAGSRPTIIRGEIRRLAIHAHGVSGTIFVNGKTRTPALTAATVATEHAHLHQIGLMTPDDAQNPAVIEFPGCLAGQGKAGTELLIALSRVWPNRKVVAFASLGYAPGGKMSRSGERCTEPGMRDTNAVHVGDADANAARYWPDMKAWPWASEASPRAKVVLNQRIIRGGEW
ncbi:MAG: hypothetical protein R2729_28980 [Bryobacteraceae bacterium]